MTKYKDEIKYTRVWNAKDVICDINSTHIAI